MTRRLSDDDMERLLTGRTPSDPSWRALGDVLSIPEDLVPLELAAAHVAAAARAAAAARGLTAGAAAAPPTLRGRRLVFRGAASGMVLKLILGTAAALAATGGAAAAGLLPGPMQNAIADGAAHLGLDLPRAAPANHLSPPTSILPGGTDTTAAPLGSTTFRWSGASCAGLPLAVEVYSSAGILTLGSVTGDTDEIDARPERIEIGFADGVRVRIQLEDGLPAVTEDRSCGDEDGTNGDDPDDDETAVEEPDEDGTAGDDPENDETGGGETEDRSEDEVSGDETTEEASGHDDDSSPDDPPDEGGESDGDLED